jgi:hypothetical protein
VRPTALLTADCQKEVISYESICTAEKPAASL